jgi:hypothetical protein
MNDLPKIVIPTYLRAELISDLTLKYLEEQDYPSDKIFLFVANQAERERYAQLVPRRLYAEIVVGELGLKEQRNFISQDVRPQRTVLRLGSEGSSSYESGGTLWGDAL